VRGAILGIDLEGEAAEWAAVFRVGHEDALPVAGEDREDAFRGLVGRGECRVDDHGAEGEQVALEHFAEEGFLALEEVVEAAGVDLGVGEEVGHARAGESAFPEEVAGGVDEAVAGGDGLGHVDKKNVDRGR